MSSVGRTDLSVSGSIGWRRAFAGRSCWPASKSPIARTRELAIQRLFAGGLALQSVLAGVSDRPQAAEAVPGVVDDLDGIIGIIRSTIYALGQRDSAGRTRLRARLVAEAGEAAAPLGFTPALRMTGLWAPSSPTTSPTSCSSCSEALADAARHSHATAVDVTVEATATHLRLRVRDNGRGVGPARTRRSGLAALRVRATGPGASLLLVRGAPPTILQTSHLSRVVAAAERASQSASSPLVTLKQRGTRPRGLGQS